MNLNSTTPWHKTSYDRFLQELLPDLLAARLPLAGYEVVREPSCTVRVTIAGKQGEVEVALPDIPQPDADGVFRIDGASWIVVPLASDEALQQAEIRCVGEQLYAYVEARLGDAPPDLPWDEALVRSWLPLDAWVREFLHTGTVWDETGAQTTLHRLDDLNWLARNTHLRRIIVPRRTRVFHPDEPGRVCPYETPEGPNIGHILTVANGAAIHDGKLVIHDASPEGVLGLSALMVPFLEHNDANRQLFGVNMMRQWLVPPDPEPAYVQTGFEPDAPDFWCGRNLLTAFISWGPDTYEDAILVSESCAKRLAHPHALEPGDKLSNRHGTKGVVSRIVPDEAMPHLADGTPVELVFNFMGCHTRLNFGQIREAVMSRIARAEGAPAIVPPFCAPNEPDLKARLRTAGLSESGMEVLTQGRNGPRLQRPSTVGWVYWGKTMHLARTKLRVPMPDTRPEELGNREYLELREAGAFNVIAELFNPGAESPMLANLTRRLRAAGIAAEMCDERLTFRFASPETDPLHLARPVPHPWLHERPLTEIGACEPMPEYAAVVQANARLARMLETRAPDRLTQQATARLEDTVRAFFDALLSPEHLRFSVETHVTARSVLAPDGDLRVDQVGLPDAMARALFGPVLGQSADRVDPAALDATMTKSWVVLEAPPAQLPTSFLAFHAVRHADRVIRFPVLATALMNADFDGDQARVFLPLTDAGQRDAAERLSVAAHLHRDPGLVQWLTAEQDMAWGLALLSLTPDGRNEIDALAGIPVQAPMGFVTRKDLQTAVQALLEREGVDAALDALERLKRRGYEITQASGASIHPFFGWSVYRPDTACTEDPAVWDDLAEEVEEHLVSRTDFDSIDIGPQLLAAKTGARGLIRHLARLCGPRGTVLDASGNRVIVRNGLARGQTPQEALACAVPAREGLATLAWNPQAQQRAVPAREGLAQISAEITRAAYGMPAPTLTGGLNVLARAMRSKRPGVVFARAAAVGEIDPLTDTDTRAFVGLPVRV